MSRGHLHRRLRDVLSTSPTEIVRSIRLDRAAQLLKSRAGSVSEVAYATGFQSVSHFCRCFKARFDATPSTYREREAAPPAD
jgi:transcriptional regulator GlxA family with amidase domain